MNNEIRMLQLEDDLNYFYACAWKIWKKNFQSGHVEEMNLKA